MRGVGTGNYRGGLVGFGKGGRGGKCGKGGWGGKSYLLGLR